MAFNRSFHIKGALEFLRKAPNNTEAFRYGQRKPDEVIDEVITDVMMPGPLANFYETFMLSNKPISRRELSLQLNTAKLLPREVEKPISVPVNNSNTTDNMTTANGTRANTTGASIEIVVGHSKVFNFKLLNTISQVDVANIVLCWLHTIRFSLKNAQIPNFIDVCVGETPEYTAPQMCKPLWLKRFSRSGG